MFHHILATNFTHLVIITKALTKSLSYHNQSNRQFWHRHQNFSACSQNPIWTKFPYLIFIEKQRYYPPYVLVQQSNCLMCFPMAKYVIHLHTKRKHKPIPLACVLLSTPNLKGLYDMCPYNHALQNELSDVHKVSTSIFHLLSKSQVWII